MRKEIIDQSIHFIIPFLVVVLLGLTPLQGAVVGFLAALVREVTEMQRGGRPPWTRRGLTDIVFWTLGGAVGGFV